VVFLSTKLPQQDRTQSEQIIEGNQLTRKMELVSELSKSPNRPKKTGMQDRRLYRPLPSAIMLTGQKRHTESSQLIEPWTTAVKLRSGTSQGIPIAATETPWRKQKERSTQDPYIKLSNRDADAAKSGGIVGCCRKIISPRIAAKFHC
jgi:hypothetical protein